MKPRRGSPPVTTGGESPQGCSLALGSQKRQKETSKQSNSGCGGSEVLATRLPVREPHLANLTSGGGIPPGIERLVLRVPLDTIVDGEGAVNGGCQRTQTREKSKDTVSRGYPMFSFIHIVNTEFQAACQGQIYVLCKRYLILTLTLEGRQYHWAHFNSKEN